MKFFKRLAIFGICVFGAINISYAQASLSDKFAGDWQGSGTLMGSEADFEMRWEKELNGQFLQLTFQNKRMAAGGRSMIFNAIAIYRPIDQEWTGTWFDVRGVSFPVNGTVKDNVLTVEWGKESFERGRTIYTLVSSDSMYVADYVLQEGTYNQFGEAGYKRITAKSSAKDERR